MLQSRHNPRAFLEKRTEARAPLGLTGKVFVPGRTTADDCRVVDFSPGGAGLKCSGSLPVGTKVVLYVDGFGRFEGIVVDRDRTRVGVRIHASPSKRLRTAEQLSEFVASGKIDGSPLRRTIRMKDLPTLNRFTDASGHSENCEVIDIALGGASLRTDTKPELGSLLHFGVTIGRVVRHTESGVAVEFIGRDFSDPAC